MKTEKPVVEKIARVQAALEEGALASHDVVRSMGPADDRTPSSWGPAMRR